MTYKGSIEIQPQFFGNDVIRKDGLQCRKIGITSLKIVGSSFDKYKILLSLWSEVEMIKLNENLQSQIWRNLYLFTNGQKLLPNNRKTFYYKI